MMWRIVFVVLVVALLWAGTTDEKRPKIETRLAPCGLVRTTEETQSRCQ